MQTDGATVAKGLTVLSGLVALVCGLFLPAQVAPEYSVAVQDGVATEWDELSPEAQTVVQVARSETTGSNATELTFERRAADGNSTARFGPYPDDLPDVDSDQVSASQTIIERNGTLLVFAAEQTQTGVGRDNRTVAVAAADRTDTLLLRADELSAHATAVVDHAATRTDDAGFYANRPPELAEGLDATPGGLFLFVVEDRDVFVLDDGDRYRTVVVSEPIRFVPVDGVLTLGLVVGALGTVPALVRVVRRRVGWRAAAAAAVAVAGFPPLLCRVVLVGPPRLLVHRLRGLAGLVILPIAGALVCTLLVWLWETDAERARETGDGE